MNRSTLIAAEGPEPPRSISQLLANPAAQAHNTADGEQPVIAKSVQMAKHHILEYMWPKHQVPCLHGEDRGCPIHQMS